MKTVTLDDVTNSAPFEINSKADLTVARGSTMTVDMILNALEHSHRTIRQFGSFDVDVFALLGMRNLSAFIGEIFAAQMVRAGDGLFRKNPHQDGYPDLLVMDKEGQSLWDKLQGRLRDKGPFSPFETGGVEVKATCGSVPTPKEMAKLGLEKPDIGDQRISVMKGYDWKAHHRETNNLLAIVWDFIERTPRIVGVFYSNQLTEDDWGAIVQPREGGGRTTSVSIMTRGGVQKMTRAWVAVRKDAKYQDLFSRKCGGIDFYSAVGDETVSSSV